MLTIMRIYFIRPQIEISTRLIILSVKIEKNCQILYRKKCMEKWDLENRTSGSIFDFRNGFYGKFWPRKRYNITYLGIVNFLLLCPICRPSLPEPCLRFEFEIFDILETGPLNVHWLFPYNSDLGNVYKIQTAGNKILIVVISLGHSWYLTDCLSSQISCF